MIKSTKAQKAFFPSTRSDSVKGPFISVPFTGILKDIDIQLENESWSIFQECVRSLYGCIHHQQGAVQQRKVCKHRCCICTSLTVCILHTYTPSQLNIKLSVMLMPRNLPALFVGQVYHCKRISEALTVFLLQYYRCYYY